MLFSHSTTICLSQSPWNVISIYQNTELLCFGPDTAPKLDEAAARLPAVHRSFISVPSGVRRSAVKESREHAFSQSEVKIVQRSRILRPALIFTTTGGSDVKNL